jgi:hypothetical protein
MKQVSRHVKRVAKPGPSSKISSKRNRNPSGRAGASSPKDQSSGVSSSVDRLNKENKAHAIAIEWDLDFQLQTLTQLRTQVEKLNPNVHPNLATYRDKLLQRLKAARWQLDDAQNDLQPFKNPALIRKK